MAAEAELQVVVHSPALSDGVSAAPNDQPRGLTSSDVLTLRAQHGWNEVPKKKKNKILMFLKHFWGLSAWMLEAVIIASLALRAWAEAVVPAVLLILNAILGYIQEARAASAIDSLTDRLHIESRALRDGKWIDLPARELVPEDIIKLRDGDVIPADVSCISGSCEADQAALTGESEPVRKNPGDTGYAGTIVTSGEVLSKVVSIGANTKFGMTAELIGSSEPKIHAQDLLKRLVYIKIGFVGALVIIVLIVVGVRKQNIPKIIPLLLSTLVSAMPVALPAMLTITMALGTRKLGKVGALVSRLAATEDAARMTVLFSDKTGTITQNRLRVTGIDPLAGIEESEVLLAAALSSRPENIKDPIDSAVLAEREKRLSGEAPGGRLASLTEYTNLNFVPFSAATRCTESTVKHTDGRTYIVKKGAVPTLVAQCVGLTAEQREWIDATMTRHAGNGERTLAVIRLACDEPAKENVQAAAAERAVDLEGGDKSDKKHKKKHKKHKKKKEKAREPIGQEEEGKEKAREAIEPVEQGQPSNKPPFRFLGIVALADPPREDSKEAIAKIQGYGVRVVMLTGDSLPIARYVASKVGLGDTIESLAAWRKKFREELQPDEQHVAHGSRKPRGKYTSVLETPLLEEATGFAEVFPEDKHAFVKQLQQRKHVVGMTGDGVNDAPALKQAEVGVAVSNATDVAKKAASVVLIPEGLAPITNLIEEGRRIHSRLVTWIFTYVAKTFQNATFILVLYLIEREFPVRAIHVLLLLLFQDLILLTLSADNARVCKFPAKWHLLRIVVIAAIVGLMSMGEGMAFYYLGKNYLEFDGDQLQTYCFLMMFFFSSQNIFVARERRFFFSSLPFWLIIVILAIGTIAFMCLCAFNVGVFHIKAVPLRWELFLLALSLGSRLLVNDPVKYLLFRVLLPRVQ